MPHAIRTRQEDESTTAKPAEARDDGCAACDWVAAASLFAIIGGGGALLLADWSVLAGLAGAAVSGLVGVVFAEL